MSFTKTFTKTIHANAWQQAVNMLIRTPQAINLSGVEGMGKCGIALELARWLLCQKVSPFLKAHYQSASQAELNNLPNKPCGECSSCKMFVTHENTDFRMLYPQIKKNDLAFWLGENIPTYKNDEKKSQNVISVGDVRLLDDFINLSSFYGGLRVVVIWPADKMNNAAANALLKTLEEPVRDLVYILVTDHNRRLPATIISRCREVNVATPEINSSQKWVSDYLSNQTHEVEKTISEDEIIKIVEIARGAPLRAIKWIRLYPLISKLQSAFSQKQGLQMMDFASEIVTFVQTKTKKTDYKLGMANTVELEDALDLLQRLISREISNNINKVSASKIQKLYYLIDEVVFFKKHIVYTLNTRQVFERLLLKLAVINKL